ncbi:MAG: hypothetical protein OXH09_17785 [Gammaproteobacteria bacterium]|nr:hypothetical protein [Gammaproteobacteria bacterium]
MAALSIVLVVGVVIAYSEWNEGPAPPPVAQSDGSDTASHEKLPSDPRAEASDAEMASQLDCLDLLGKASSNLALATDRKRFGIRSFLTSLENQGFNSLAQRLVADLAGIGAFDLDMRSYAGAQSGSAEVEQPRTAVYSLPRTGVHSLPLSRAQSNRVRDALQAPAIESLIDEFQADPSLLRRYWLREDPFDLDQATTVLGHAIRVRGQELYRAIDTIPEEVSFGLHELAVAVGHGVGAADLATLLDRSAVDPTTSWRDRRTPRDNTLAMVATLSANPGALQLLLTLGSDPSLGRRSVLDELPLPNEQTEAVQEVVHVLLAHGDRPYLPSTRAALKRWLPQLSALPLHPDAEVELATFAMEDVARELASLVEDWDRRVMHASRIEQHCQFAWDDETGPLLHRSDGLAAKMRRQDELDKRYEIAQRESLRSSQRWIEQLEPEAARILEAIFEAVNESRWKDAMLLADSLAVDAVDELLLFRALFFGAPMEVIETLIDRAGGVLPERAVLTLAAAPNEQALPVAKMLNQRYRLDLHFIDERGRNAVSEAVSLFWDTQFNSVVVDENVARWLTFLSENSVTMKPESGGMDPLDLVLQEMVRRPFTNRAGVRVARFLIDHGAAVGASHRDLVDEIAMADWDGYRQLIQEVPELEQGP